MPIREYKCQNRGKLFEKLVCSGLHIRTAKPHKNSILSSRFLHTPLVS